eukprot:GHVR01180631.1.p1 GENE.GHVR01180631.1~~GHVR01180631.1.p1  ORF type:complete len:105 (+),score=3.08 GHVR01180631.1:490-804(+)
MIRFTHNIWIGFNGDSFNTAAPANTITSITILTVNRNCKNLRTESNIFLPHLIAVTIDTKLSSSKMIPEAYFVIPVPEIPIAIPTSAFLTAGGSPAPSPVIATT